MPDQDAQAATGTSASQSQAGGQQPQTPDPHAASQASAASTSQADGSAATTAQAAGKLTYEEIERELAKVRSEAAENRVAKRELEKLQRERMSKEEQLAADLATAQKERDTLIATQRSVTLAYETKLQAAALGIIDPDVAVKLLDASQIEYADDGTPKNLAKLLQALLAAKPYLAANAAQTQSGTQTGARQASSASATNQAAARTATFTESAIAAMSPEDYQKHRAAIFQAQREGRILPG